MYVAARLGENGISRVMDGLRQQRSKSLLAVTRYNVTASSLLSSRAHPSASGLNSVVRFNGRQLRYVNGNAWTEYEEESAV
jgi:hypothetical protein